MPLPDAVRCLIECPPLALRGRARPDRRSAASARAAHTPGAAGTRLALHDNTVDERAQVEAFIGQRYDDAFGSKVRSFMPRLHSLRDAEGTIRGAFGLRPARERLYLEHYLNVPVEQAITEHTGVDCERGTVVEVGHLSGSFAGDVRAMIGLVTRQLHREGVRWVAFTGTASLRNAFHRMGLRPTEVAIATPERLPAEERLAWGDYYADSPRVFVGNVAEGERRLIDGFAGASAGAPVATAAGAPAVASSFEGAVR
ncbi:N/A [soil metagenome]